MHSALSFRRSLVPGSSIPAAPFWRKVCVSLSRKSSRSFTPVSFRRLAHRHIRNLLPVLSATVCIAVAGCSSFTVQDEHGKSEFSGRVDAHGSLPAIHRTFDSLSFVKMLAGGKASECDGESGSIRVYPNHNGADYQCAIDRFYERTTALNDAAQRLERNRIQEHILAVSEERCNAYKKYLRYDQGSTNFWMGSTATLAAALGAIAPGLAAAKTYSATAGVLTGINAEYNQAYFGNLFYTVIAKGIDERRRDAYREIQTYGQVKGLANYTMEAALKDAIVYDGMCSAVSAMEYAEKSIQLVNDPGIDSLNRILVKANQMHDIIEKKTTDLGQLQKSNDGKLATSTENIRFGTLLAFDDSNDPQHFIQTQVQHAALKVADFAPVMAEISRRLSGAGLNNLNAKKDAETKIKGKFITTDSDLYKAYLANLSACGTALPDKIKGLEDAKAELTRALTAHDQMSIDTAKHKISQAQTKIGDTLESAGFATRHLDNLIEGFIAQTVTDIGGNVTTPTYDFNGHGSFGTTCGEIK